MSDALQAEGVALRADPLIALRHAALSTRRPESLANLPGGFPSRRKGAGQEVADLRDYQLGDDLRHLDRSTSARTGRLHVRQFQQERDRVILLVADFRTPMLWGVSRALLSVSAAEALSLIGWSGIEDGGRVGLLVITPGAPLVIASRGRVRGQLAVIGGLVQAHAAALDAACAGAEDPQLDGALAAVERICPAGAEVVIASSFDTLGPDFEASLSRIERRRAVRLLEVSDAQDIPAGRYPMRFADGRQRRLQIGASGGIADPGGVAGRPAVQINASASLDRLASQLTPGGAAA